MFGKTLKIQGSVFFKGKDRENLETSLRKQFNALTVKKIFEDTEECMQEKLVGSKMIIYHTDEYPAFVDGTGKEDFVPTLFVVAEFPQLVGTLILNKGIDETALLKSGKVLWNQISNAEKLGEFKKDSIKKLLNSEKKLLAIVAIGCDSADLKKELEKGVAGYILHKQGDKLWEHGPQKLGDPIEPENFDEIQEIRTQNYEQYSDDDIDLNMIAPGTKKQTVKKENKKVTKKPIQQQQQQVKQQQQQFSDDSDDDGKQKKGGQQKQQKQQQQQQVGGIPLKVMDEYIKESFLNACKIGVNDKQLPLEGQVFYEKYMIPFTKPGIELDFKNSTYQKIGKFLQAMNKDGLIEYKELKKGGQPQIIKIDRQHEQITDWDPTVLKAQKKQDDEKDGKQQQAVYKSQIEVQELFLPKGPLIKIFVKEGDENQKLEPLTREQYVSKLNQFIKSNFRQERKYIILTEEFTTELGIKQQESESEEEEEQQDKQFEKNEQKDESKKRKEIKPVNQFTLEQIQKRIEELMERSFKIKNLRLNQSEIKQGEFKGLQLIAEKQHNQQVNRIVGLEYFGFDPQGKPEDIYSYAYLVKSLQENFHCAVAVHDSVVNVIQHGKGKDKGKEKEVEKGKEKGKDKGKEKTGKEVQNEQAEEKEQVEQKEQAEQKKAGHQKEYVVQKEIILQKNVFDQLPDFIYNVLKIESKYVHEQNKLGGNKKKQEGMTRQ